MHGEEESSEEESHRAEVVERLKGIVRGDATDREEKAGDEKEEGGQKVVRIISAENAAQTYAGEEKEAGRQKVRGISPVVKVIEAIEPRQGFKDFYHQTIRQIAAHLQIPASYFEENRTEEEAEQVKAAIRRQKGRLLIHAPRGYGKTKVKEALQKSPYIDTSKPEEEVRRRSG